MQEDSWSKGDGYMPLNSYGTQRKVVQRRKYWTRCHRTIQRSGKVLLSDLNAGRFMEQRRWIHAPEFLWNTKESCPEEEVLDSVSQDDPEVRKSATVRSECRKIHGAKKMDTCP